MMFERYSTAERDVFGSVATESNAVATATYSLSSRGNATNETQSVDAVSISLAREFDAFGRLAAFDGTVFSCAADGWLDAVSNEIASVEYIYTTDRLDAGYAIVLSNGLEVTRTLTRDAYRRELVTTITNFVNGVAVDGLAYSYDALGRPVSRNDDTFGYNERGEVVFSRRGAEIAEDSYAYDYIGNLLTAAFSCGVTNTYASNNRNQYTAIQEVSALSAPLRETSYDLDGNITQYGDWTYTYDAANRLKTVSTNGVLLLTNFYDAKSRRVKKVTQEATTTFFYDNWNLIEERVAYTNGTSSTIRYYWGKDISGTLQGAGGVGGLLYLTVSNSNSQLQLYIPFYDNNGNVTRYLDASGNTVAQYTYDAFGNTILQSGPLADFFRHRFSTKYFDPESGLYYYGYRFYNPVLMRWLNRDPIEEEGGLNLYVFSGNDSICESDALGLKWKIFRDGKTFATAIPQDSGDTFASLAREVGLDLTDYTKWAHTSDRTPVLCKKYLIPNMKIYHKGIRRFYENWGNNIIGDWDSGDDIQMDRDRRNGFNVVVKDSIGNRDVISDLGLDGLYEYTFTGHGLGEGSIATEEFDSSVAPVRATLYGIHRLTLQGCDTANDMIEAKNVKNVGWCSNVAVAGTFVGYMGKVNLFNASNGKTRRKGTNSKLVIIMKGTNK